MYKTPRVYPPPKLTCIVSGGALNSAHLLTHSLVPLCCYCCCSHRVGRYQLPLLTVPETAYLVGLLPLELYAGTVHHLLGLDRRLPFLPLMLTSVYCAVGVAYVWLKAQYLMLTQ